MKKLLSFATTLGLVLANFSVSAVSAEGRWDYDPIRYGGVQIVITVNENGNVLLTDNHEIEQEKFRTYSGEDFDLEIGDVVNVSYGLSMASLPSRPYYDEDFSIEYLGKATELYPESVKELTYAGEYDWTDADGITYDSLRSYHLYSFLNYSYNIHPSDFSIGDTALCVVVPEREEALVILEKTSGAEYTPGDATGDGVVNLIDVIAMNQNIMTGTKLAPAGVRASDFNGDGKLDASESLLLLKYVVKVIDTLQFE